jgi:tRNA threonylcarbamoyladenosine biosynthesis protein TsaE
MLAAPSEAGFFRQSDFHHRRAIREGAVSMRTRLVRDAIRELLEPAAQHLVIVAAQRVTRYVRKRRIVEDRLRGARSGSKIVHAHRDDTQRPRHELRWPAPSQAMPCHIIHLAMPAAREPREESRLGSRQIAIGDADVLETEIGTPRFDVAGERRVVDAGSARNGNVLHNSHLRSSLELFLPDEAATLALGAALAGTVRPGMAVFLSGDLGAGKTTLVRGLLRGLGHPGRVKSPTFSLVEVYKLSSLYFYHFDFYRFGHPDEWRETGLQEHFNPETVCLVEWPENAAGLPVPDLQVRLAPQGMGRSADLEAHTEVGRECLKRLASTEQHRVQRP